MFKKKPKKAPKATPWAKPRPKAKNALKRTTARSGGIPAWVKAIPKSEAHGSGDLQKRMWKITSDYVRIRDWYKYKGKCVATGNRIAHWTLGDAGHFKSYAVCNGMFKWDIMNIHLQSKSSNGWGGQAIGHAFGETLKKRYGDGILEWIELSNRDTPLKFTTQDILNEMEWLLEDFKSLPEQPDWYKRAYKLLHEN